jgi:zinc-binding alcohol dehydrogenase family protein
MRAVGYREAGSLERADALLNVELPDPQPGPLDLLVSVDAVAVNPVDTKIRVRRSPTEGRVEVLGWDAVGMVVAVGAEVSGFAVGDRVFYAGAINRPGCDSQLHVVDHRIVGHAPASLDDAEAAALPLTAITAWELLFDRLAVPLGGGSGQTLLILGAAGGVGSMLVQLARQLTGLTVIGTASRAESQAWVRDLGAHHVIDHHQPWADQLQAVGIDAVDLQACLTHTGDHWASVLEVAAPQGRVALIDDPAAPLDTNAMKSKCLSLHWEFMFARSLFQTADMAEQGRLLDRVAQLVDDGVLRTTLSSTLSPICASTLLQAHRTLESGKARGKIAVVGW